MSSFYVHPRAIVHAPSKCGECAALYSTRENARQESRAKARASSPVAAALALALSNAVTLTGSNGKPLNATAKAAKLRKADIAPELAHIWLNQK